GRKFDTEGADAAIGQDELTDLRVIAAEDAFGLQIALGVLGNRKIGTAAAGGVAGNIWAAVVRREVAGRLAQCGRSDVLLADEDGVAGAIGQGAQAGSTVPVGHDPLDNLGVAHDDRPIRGLVVEIALVTFPIATRAGIVSDRSGMENALFGIFGI